MNYRLYTLCTAVLASALCGSPTRADDESGDGDGDSSGTEQIMPTVVVTATASSDFWPIFDWMPDIGADATPPSPNELPDKPDDCDTSEKPVVFKTGNKVRPEPDFATRHSGGLFLQRFYNANANDRAGMFGAGWFSSFDPALMFIFADGSRCWATPGMASPCVSPSTPGTFLSVSRVRPDGSVYTYLPGSSSSSWVRMRSGAIYETLTRNADGTWTIVTAERMQETYTAAGFISSIRNDQGFGLTFSYLTNRLQTVTHTNGSMVSLEWNGNLVSAATDPAGNRYLYGYAGGSLASVTFPGPDPYIRTYHYDGPGTPAKYTGISENGARYTQNDYYPDGRVLHSGLAGDVEQDTFTYGTNTDGTRYTQMTNALGLSVKYIYQTLSGEERLARVDRSAAVGCPAAASRYGYRSDGALEYEDDFNGRRVCHSYDGVTQMFEWVRVDGLANTANCAALLLYGAALPAEARRTSQEMHVDWSLVAKRSIPSKLTTWVYNGRPDPFNGNAVANCITPDAALPTNTTLPVPTKPLALVCRRVEQATTDTNGSQGLIPTLDAATPARTWTFTYNQWGQLATATDPRGNRTTYAYYPSTSFAGTDPQATGHYWGDLMSITNAKGTVTRFLSYDKAGRVLEVQDGNGASTRYRFWPRGWLMTVAVDSDTTRFYFWPNGLLMTVEQPDGSILDYGYDAVHRLTSVADGRGGSITFSTTYDTANQQVLKVESVKDASGMLLQNVRRTHDALGRLRRISGGQQ